MLSAAQHGARLTLAGFPPGRGTSVLLSGDVRGRLCIHTFSNLLLRTNVSSKVLVSGQYGALLGISHLTPFAMPAPALPKSAPSGTSPRQGPDTASVSPVGTGRFSPKGLLQPGGGSRGATPPLSPKLGAPGGGGAAAATEAAWKAYFEVGVYTDLLTGYPQASSRYWHDCIEMLGRWQTDGSGALHIHDIPCAKELHSHAHSHSTN